ncbi:MAG: hypothetical protein PVF37_20950 [Desulfobacterales bacterium]|jgi:hypothetical protein
MRNATMLSRISVIVCLLIGTIYIPNGWAQASTAKKPGATGLQQRIDFGNAYIMGQSIKSGAVYLLHRKQSDIKSMLEYRENYRQEILEDFIIQDENLDQNLFEDQKL